MSVTRLNKVGYGLSEPLPGIPQDAIIAVRNPTGRDRAPLGQLWVNTVANAFFILTSVVGGVSTWTNAAGGAGIFTSLTVTPGPTFISSTTVDIIGTDAVNNAIIIQASNAAGGIRMTSGTGGIGLSSTGAVNLDGLAPSHFTVAGGSLTLSTIGATTNVTSDTSVVVDGGNLLTIGTSANPGQVDIVAGVVNAAGAAATLNSNVGIVTLTGLVTASGATQVVTITNSTVIVTSGIICSASNIGANDAQMTVTRIENLVGGFLVTLVNNGTQALNGDVHISFIVLS